MNQLETEPKPARVAARTRWFLWGGFALLWTIALLTPIPAGGSWEIEHLQLNLKFFVTKALHMSAYAVLAGLSGWLGIPVRWRWLLMFGLMAHASLTELVQTVIPTRTGSLMDVLFDQGGIALGLLITWSWWAAPADNDHAATNG